ncbi:hypothetical protein BAUCODRAFT_554682 [Baudoinia panamericana UAMH 10762]|uniref:Uncharacterized protein n=1 Tax=Baudoinia panamericana (strain UAMH 10762) TaxID=717646 RepID=M2N6F9_BAUPA|nr:uncharacterized protein BAUCODRAFT_554682 [Baudoinia panamericana UAMH 10762]EMC94634.1 hypothetical protein BAUCODRAFT_554682 [Baudoinia panamericana UAMH 10762]
MLSMDSLGKMRFGYRWSLLDSRITIPRPKALLRDFILSLVLPYILPAPRLCIHRLSRVCRSGGCQSLKLRCASLVLTSLP